MKQKFKVGDKVKLSSRCKNRFNCITTNGTILEITKSGSGRVVYVVQFEGKKFKMSLYSYDLNLL